MKRCALFCLNALITLSLLTPTMSRAIEEPSFTVVKKIGEVEIRQYAPFVVAEVTVNADANDAGSQAFPILAGYIFGKNKGERKMAMTAPVIQLPAPVIQTPAPVKLEMTAPVTQTAVPGGYVVQFVLPKTVTLATAPEPLDARVRLREMPAANWAVITYSGLWSQRNFEENLNALRAALKTADIAVQGEPVLSRYNGPLTPWFLRRNEVWLALK